MQVHTEKGLIDREKLEMKDVITEGHDPNTGSNWRAIATEWYLDGELVRRDAAVSILSGVTMNSEQESF